MAGVEAHRTPSARRGCPGGSGLRGQVGRWACGGETEPGVEGVRCTTKTGDRWRVESTRLCERGNHSSSKKPKLSIPGTAHTDPWLRNRPQGCVQWEDGDVLFPPLPSVQLKTPTTHTQVGGGGQTVGTRGTTQHGSLVFLCHHPRLGAEEASDLETPMGTDHKTPTNAALSDNGPAAVPPCGTESDRQTAPLQPDPPTQQG